MSLPGSGRTWFHNEERSRMENLRDRFVDVPASGKMSIFPRNDEDTEVTVRYHVEGGVIQLNPSTFSVDRHKGYLVAYHLDGYPERLDPVILNYELRK
jgi:hypothetical protein